MVVGETQTTILQQVLEHCNRSTHMPLGFLGVDEHVWDCPPDPKYVANALREAFAVEQLAASGVVVVSEDGSVKLTAPLSGGGRFISLHDATTDEPFEILTCEGCVSPAALPIFEILRDRHTQHGLEQVGSTLFVAFDIEDVVMLRACGLSATLASGLAKLPLEDVSRFFESFAVKCLTREPVDSDNVFHGIIPQSSSPADSCRVPLVFLAWSPSTLVNAVPLQLKVVVDYFRQLDQFMGVNLFDLQVWEPDDETLDRLRFIAGSRSAAIFRSALREAVGDIGTDMTSFGLENRAPLQRVCDFPTAAARLQAVTSSDPNSHPMGEDRRKRAWSDFQKCLNQQFINPIRKYALESCDPIESTLMMAIAGLSEVFHTETALIGEQQRRRMSERRVDRVDQSPDNHFKNLLAIADRLINMTKAIDRCTQPRTTIIQSPSVDSQTFPLLPRSE